MDEKEIEHEDRVWSEIFKKEIENKNFKKFSSYWWEDYYNEITNFVTTNILCHIHQRNILETWSWSWKSSLLIWKYVHHITLLDISKNALKYAIFLAEKLWIKNISTTEWNMFNMVFKNDSFDFTWNIWTIEHYKKEDIIKIIKEMIRVTQHDWYIAIWFPNFYSWPILKAVLNSRFKIFQWYKLDTEKFYNEKEIIELINQIEWITISDIKISKFWNFMPIWLPKCILQFCKKFETIFYKNKFLTFISFKISKKWIH